MVDTDTDTDSTVGNQGFPHGIGGIATVGHGTRHGARALAHITGMYSGRVRAE